MRAMKSLGFAAVAVLLPIAALAGNWELNDVSILLPIPAGELDAGILRPETTGKGGPLFPEKYRALLPRLSPDLDPAAVAQDLKVVAVRIDPCFAFGCRKQVRMAWQPVIPGGVPMVAWDAAVHTFYDLSPAQFEALLEELQAARQGVGAKLEGLPLSVHPVIAEEGLEGPYWTRLRKILLKHAGAGNLTRFTFMTTEAFETMWDFGGFDIVAGKARRMVIPRVGMRLQSFVDKSGSGPGFWGGAKPASPAGDSLDILVTKSSALSAADAPKLKAAAAAIHRIENPRIHSPESMDCVSCHVAQPARAWAVAAFPQLGLGAGPGLFTSAEFDLSNTSPLQGQSNVLRAFGYLGTQPAISRRVIHESAAVAEALNSR
jgi:hypothetical protein